MAFSVFTQETEISILEQTLVNLQNIEYKIHYRILLKRD
jgi:hypothetical protein